jgi:hypothetical protein
MRTRTFSNIGFIAADMEKTYNTRTERGFEFEKPPKKESWGASAVFNDLDGNTFALSSKRRTSPVKGLEKQLAPCRAIRIQRDADIRPAGSSDSSAFFRGVLADVDVELDGFDDGWM